MMARDKSEAVVSLDQRLEGKGREGKGRKAAYGTIRPEVMAVRAV